MRACKPRLLFSPFDQGIDYGGPINLVAENLGLPTYTLVHGAFGTYSAQGFTSLNAHYVFVWGDMQRDLFRQAGVDEDRIIVAGCQRLGLSELPSPDEARESVRCLGLEVNGPIILVGFTVIPEKDRKTWVHAVSSLHEKLPGASFLCRLHPSQNKQNYSSILQENSRLKIIESSEISLGDCMVAADLVIAHTSTIGFDALFYKKLLAVYDPYPTKFVDITYDIVEYGAALYAQEPFDMAEQINQIFHDKSKSIELHERANEFLKYYLTAQGDEAADNVARHLSKYLNNKCC